jgi:hypothetical protein
MTGEARNNVRQKKARMLASEVVTKVLFPRMMSLLFDEIDPVNHRYIY